MVVFCCFWFIHNYFLKADSVQKINEIKFAKIIPVIDSINVYIQSILEFFFKTLSNSILKDDDLYKNLEFYFAECLLSILYYV